ncbi:MAG TPA: hypothetical protein VIY29_14140 [Ktedonobacteraceae bacterium]
MLRDDRSLLVQFDFQQAPEIVHHPCEYFNDKRPAYEPAAGSAAGMEALTRLPS